MKRRPPIEVGAEYNDWTVVRQVNLNIVICKCKCGNQREVRINNMLSSKSKRCMTCAGHRSKYKRILSDALGEIK